ncbi:MAG: regulatory protein RecX [Vicinamibacterales bacterium]
MPRAESARSKAFQRPPERPTATAYVTALTMLSRRELSEKQICDRLKRRQYDSDEIDVAIARLKAERSLDDTRVAAAIARTQTSIKRRGQLRVRREIEQAGISRETARAAVDAVFGDLDQDALLESALARRLRGERPIADDREFQRLYRYLVTQGFESDRALKALNARRSR